MFSNNEVEYLAQILSASFEINLQSFVYAFLILVNKTTQDAKNS